MKNKILTTIFASSVLFVNVSAIAASERGYLYPERIEKRSQQSKVTDVTPTAQNKRFANVTINFESLPFDEAIVRIKGDGSRRVALLVDPTCPHSRALEENLEKIDNITIYTFVASILEGSEDTVQAIHCSGNNAQKGAAYDSFSKGSVILPIGQCAANTDGKIKRAFGEYKNIAKVTPTIIFESNLFVSSVMEVDEIEYLLEQSRTKKL